VEDIALLLTQMVGRLGAAEGLTLADDAVACLERYAWPGNVRELINLVERLSILHAGARVTARELPEKYRGLTDLSSPRIDLSSRRLPEQGVDLKSYVAELESQFIEEALARTNGVVAKAAELLGLQRTTLVEKMKKLGIEKS